MSKHTPGPWLVDAQKIGISETNPAYQQWRYQIKYPTGLKLHPFGEIIELRGKDNKANAALIAAAPEMLEALKLALRLIENMEGKIQKLDYITVTGELERAIAKAEGKNPK